MEFWRDIWGYIKSSKKYWLVPLIFLFLMIGFLLVFSGQSAVAPFIYTVF